MCTKEAVSDGVNFWKQACDYRVLVNVWTSGTLDRGVWSRHHIFNELPGSSIVHKSVDIWWKSNINLFENMNMIHKTKTDGDLVYLHYELKYIVQCNMYNFWLHLGTKLVTC